MLSIQLDVPYPTLDSFPSRTGPAFPPFGNRRRTAPIPRRPNPASGVEGGHGTRPGFFCLRPHLRDGKMRDMTQSPAAAQPPLFDWLSARSAGVLLHPTCLPGGQGVGTLDEVALRFLDFLQAAGMCWWQVCPLGPTGYGDSPYQCFSAFAGNPYLSTSGDLVARGSFRPTRSRPSPRRGAGSVDYGALYRAENGRSCGGRSSATGSPAPRPLAPRASGHSRPRRPRGSSRTRSSAR